MGPHNSSKGAKTIIIVGAGISGLTAAIALARRGWHISLLERSKFLSEAGAGIQLGPNAMHILQDLNVASELAPYANQTKAIQINDGLTSKRLTSLPLGPDAMSKYGAPYITIHRGDLQSALLSAVANYPEIELLTGFKAGSIERCNNKITVSDENSTQKACGEALIAADGIWSHIRSNNFVSEDLAYTGKTASRSLVPISQVPKSFRSDCTHIWLAPNAHLVHYPVKGGKVLNVVAIIDEVLAGAGWETTQNAEIVHDAFSLWAREVRDFIHSIVGWKKWSLFELPELSTWSSGKTVLIGDAAHPVLPFLAQGGGLAIEDGFEIAQCLT
ncbi:MAG: FAD-dependent oxidoreductase, partial [Desulfobulbia bacterium]